MDFQDEPGHIGQQPQWPLICNTAAQTHTHTHTHTDTDTHTHTHTDTDTDTHTHTHTDTDTHTHTRTPCVAFVGAFQVSLEQTYGL